MPQNGMNYEGRRRGRRHNTCKANGQVIGQVPGTDLVNGAVAHNGCPSAATRTNERAPAGTPNSPQPQYTVNGYINHGYKVRSTKPAPQKTPGKQGSSTLAVTYGSASSRVRSTDIPGGITANGDAGLDTVTLPCNSGQMAPEPSQSAAAKRQRRWKKFRHNKRDAEVLHPREEEDWENEIQEVTLTGWEQMCFGATPYGPQDVLHFALRDLTLQQTDTTDLPLTASYSPAVHHPHPVRWFTYSLPTEPDQFADADEELLGAMTTFGH